LQLTWAHNEAKIKICTSPKRHTVETIDLTNALQIH